MPPIRPPTPPRAKPAPSAAFADEMIAHPELRHAAESIFAVEGAPVARDRKPLVVGQHGASHRDRDRRAFVGLADFIVEVVDVGFERADPAIQCGDCAGARDAGGAHRCEVAVGVRRYDADRPALRGKACRRRDAGQRVSIRRRSKRDLIGARDGRSLPDRGRVVEVGGRPEAERGRSGCVRLRALSDRRVVDLPSSECSRLRIGTNRDVAVIGQEICGVASGSSLETDSDVAYDRKIGRPRVSQGADRRVFRSVARSHGRGPHRQVIGGVAARVGLAAIRCVGAAAARCV